MRPTPHDEFVRHICESLAALGTVRSKRMFGGWCIYIDEVPMALVAHDALWFKVDDGNRVDYEAAGVGPFQPFPDKNMVMSYWQVPDAVIDDRLAILAWGRKALEAGVRSAGRQRPGKRSRRIGKPDAGRP